MKLLLDENLSRRLVPFLQHDYPGSNQVVLLGMESASASDKEVWQKAKDVLIENRDAITEAFVSNDLASVEIIPG